MALGVAAFVALAGRDSGNDADVAAPYSLIAAAESTIGARTVEFDLSVSAAESAEFAVSGSVDNESRLASLTADRSSLLALDDEALPLGVGVMTVLVDGARGIVYLDAGELGGFTAGGAAWVSIDLGVLAEQSGQSLDDVLGEFPLDPADIAHSLLSTENVSEVGAETIDGVETKRFAVTVDVAEALAAVPQADIDAEAADIELPDTVVYDVWVTADNQLRRLAFDTVVAGQAFDMQLDMTTSNETLGVELPTDAFDITGLLGF